MALVCLVDDPIPCCIHVKVTVDSELESLHLLKGVTRNPSGVKGGKWDTILKGAG